MKLVAASVFAAAGLAFLVFAMMALHNRSYGGPVMTERRVVSTDQAPAAIGPYNQAVVYGGVVYTAGQIALDPATGQMVGGGDAAQETEQVMKNLSAVLEAAGSGLDQALRCEVYLADLADYAAVNEVYGGYFGDSPPARVAVQAARLPKDARVEIACTAAVR